MARVGTAVIAGVLAVPLLLAGCGGGSADTGGASAGAGSGNVAVTYASLSVAQAAPLVLGEQEGIFAKNGIDLTIKFVETPAVVPGLLSGEFEFGYLNAPATLSARGNSVPVKSVITTSTTPKDPATYPIQLVVAAGSDIAKPSDLVGKTVATDTLFQLPDLGMRGALLESGVNADDLEIVEIPFAEMGAALAEGRIAAAIITEPFGTILREQKKITDLLSTSVGQPIGSPQSVVLASEQYINENPDVVTRFQQAANEALTFAAANDKKCRAVLPTFTKLDPKLAETIRLSPISSDDTPEGWEFWADLLVKVGVAERKADAKEAYLELG